MQESRRSLIFLAAAALLSPLSGAAAAPRIDFESKPGSVVIRIDRRVFATYAYADEKIARPYFSNVAGPGGIQLTRNHPPQKGDPGDHADFHPGLFLAFGDISGNDYWRLRAPVVHDGFVEKPAAAAGSGHFTVRNRYLTADGTATVCVETCRYTFHVLPEGYLISSSSVFSSGERDFYFGDQEEMGLGVRVATPIREERARDGVLPGSGRILDSRGRQGARATWGKAAAWCDYSGTIDGRRAGVTIMAAPSNARPSWWHNRDYGLFVANLFGREAMRQGPRSRIVVRKGEELHLGYGVLFHVRTEEQPLDLENVYEEYKRLIRDET